MEGYSTEKEAIESVAGHISVIKGFQLSSEETQALMLDTVSPHGFDLLEFREPSSALNPLYFTITKVK